MLRLLTYFNFHILFDFIIKKNCYSFHDPLSKLNGNHHLSHNFLKEDTFLEILSFKFSLLDQLLKIATVAFKVLSK